MNARLVERNLLSQEEVLIDWKLPLASEKRMGNGQALPPLFPFAGEHHLLMFDVLMFDDMLAEIDDAGLKHK